MTTESATATPAVQDSELKQVKGIRKNGLEFSSFTHTTILILHAGKQWHEQKAAFRPTKGLTSYAKRQEQRKARDVVKEKEKEMKDEKAAERQVSFDGIISAQHIIQDSLNLPILAATNSEFNRGGYKV
jgi:hypothetical protein